MKTKIIKLQDKFILVSDEPKINGDECIHLTTFNKSTHHDIDNNLTKWWKIISENPDFSLLSEEDCKTIGWVEKDIIQSLQKTSWDVEVEKEYQNLYGKWSSYYPFASSAKDERPKITKNSIKVIKIL